MVRKIIDSEEGPEKLDIDWGKVVVPGRVIIIACIIIVIIGVIVVRAICK